MTELVFDEAGARYYETGVSHAVFFPHTGGAYVWNGLVSVNIDVSGGEAEHLYYDGIKTMDRILAEEFQATIQAINTPKQFGPCEGVRDVVPGMQTHFNRRVKFNLVWMTKIGNDQDPEHAVKLHIAYNCLVQPSARAYQTISDSVSFQNRSFVITATPACGRHSYYSFDSRYFDISALLAEINSGTLPPCNELSGLEGPDLNPLVTDFTVYNPGQVMDDVTVIEGDTEVVIKGVINNGLDIQEFPADGEVELNESIATVVGTEPVLSDADDATYVTTEIYDDAEFGYTVPIPPLTGGYVEGCLFELHIRMSIGGGIHYYDADNGRAEAQVHISTDIEGENTIGGFSDGTQEGMSFSLEAFSDEIVDYIVPLNMDAWVDTDIDDVVDALKAGAYLNILNVENLNPEPELLPAYANVYEATVVMLDPTDEELSLRADPLTDIGYIDQSLGTSTGTAFSTLVDFMIKDVPYDAASDGETKNIMEFTSDIPGSLIAEFDSGLPFLAWRDETATGSPDDGVAIEYNTWYTAQVYWGVGSAMIRVWNRDLSEELEFLLDRTVVIATSPTAEVRHNAGKVGDSALTYELALANSVMTEAI